MNNRRLWELMGRKLAGEASAEELQELEMLLRAHPEQHFPATTISDLWNRASSDDTADSAAAAHERHINRMLKKGIAIGDNLKASDTPIFQLPETKSRRRYLLMTAVVTGIIIAAASWWFLPAKRAPISEVTTRNGTRSSIDLPDGTRVWLNAGSKLTYDKNFGLSNREITLSGEAFFDVTQQAEHPFVIHTTAMNVRVLGTKFNIRSYPGDNATEATLLSGSIEASPSNSNEKFILRPNEKIIVQHASAAGHDPKTTKNNTAISAVAIQHLTYYEPTPNAIMETSWMENKLIFKDMSFAELAADMERFYGVSVHFADQRKETLRFTGTFEHESIQQALDALKMTASFQYKISPEAVVIY